MRILLLGSIVVLLMAPSARAQLRLPALPPVHTPLSGLQQPLATTVADVAGTLSQARRLAAGALIRDNPRRIDVDEHGNPVVRGELLAWRTAEGLPAAVRQAGYTTLREPRSDAPGMQVSVLAPPPAQSLRRALQRLRGLDPDGLYDYNHLYLGGGILQDDAPTPPGSTAAPLNSRGVRVGLIDTGIDRAHPALREARIRTWGCGGHPQGSAHGTAVASLMVGHAPPFAGVLPEAELYAADIYCGEPTGGAVDALVGALGWLAQEGVPVINVSLVGPRNALLERAVAALTERGFVVVAAVGNDGPAAPPLYPAAYPGVVGVTAVDAQSKVLLEAARGPQVMFASIGADLATAARDGGYASARGTSFAAPIVAALIATQLEIPAKDLADAALDVLAHRATHPGRPGRDLTYGFGIVGAQYRNDPRSFSPR